MRFYIILTGLLHALMARVESRRNDRGATAVEYGLLVALIAAVIITVVAILGGKIDTAFSKITNKL